MVRLKREAKVIILIYRDPAGIRTQDPHIKSVMLYRLSYGIMLVGSEEPGVKRQYLFSLLPASYY
jgi:hypothetical protein